MSFNEDRTKDSRDDWETPNEVFKPLNAAFKFQVDACASGHNRKCNQYYAEKQEYRNDGWCFSDGLTSDWSELWRSVWMNPPYNNLRQWVTKAYKESLKGVTTVCLITARPDTKIWHEVIFPYARAICFIKGRLKFIGAKHTAKFPSAMVVFSPVPLTVGQLKTLAGFGQLFSGKTIVRFEGSD